jgi:hypothetical protein
MTNETYVVDCVFPLSGSYTFFQRLLYYIVLAFAFTVRRYRYLVAAALGYSLTASSTAAIHIFCLGIQSKIPFDLDHIAIRPILVSSILAVFPIWQYSWEFWNVDITPILVTWWIAVGVACYLVNFRLPAISGSDAEVMHCIDQKIFDMYNESLQAAFGYNYNGSYCSNPCDGVRPSAILHTEKDQLVPFVLGHWTPNMTIDIQPMPASFGSFTTFIIVFVILQYWIFGSKHPRNIRNAIFKRLYRLNSTSYSRHLLAKTAALLAFSIPFLAVLLLVMDLSLQITYMEIELRQFPESESPSAVGQWSPWAGVILALVAAGGLRLQRLWAEIDDGHDRSAPLNAGDNEEEGLQATDHVNNNNINVQRPSNTTSTERPLSEQPIVRSNTLSSLDAPHRNAAAVVITPLVRWIRRIWQKLGYNSIKKFWRKVIRFTVAIAKGLLEHLDAGWASLYNAWTDLAYFYQDPVTATSPHLEGDRGPEGTELSEIANGYNETQLSNIAEDGHHSDAVLDNERSGSSTGVTRVNSLGGIEASLGRRSATYPVEQ